MRAIPRLRKRRLSPAPKAPPEPKPARDRIVGSDVAQKIPPGGALAGCADCGQKVVIDATAVREYGRRPAAVILCPRCAKFGNAEVIDDQVSGLPAHQGRTLTSLKDLLATGPADEVTTYFEFEPPGVAATVQATRQETDSTWFWKWMNDTGGPVVVTNRASGLRTHMQPFDAIQLVADFPGSP